VTVIGKLVCNHRIGLDKVDRNWLSERGTADRASLPGHLK
jgi:hypothetical protein